MKQNKDKVYEIMIVTHATALAFLSLGIPLWICYSQGVLYSLGLLVLLNLFLVQLWGPLTFVLKDVIRGKITWRKATDLLYFQEETE